MTVIHARAVLKVKMSDQFSDPETGFEATYRKLERFAQLQGRFEARGNDIRVQEITAKYERVRSRLSRLCREAEIAEVMFEIDREMDAVRCYANRTYEQWEAERLGRLSGRHTR